MNAEKLRLIFLVSCAAQIPVIQQAGFIRLQWVSRKLEGTKRDEYSYSGFVWPRLLAYVNWKGHLMNMLDYNKIQEIERLLDSGSLEVAMRNGNYWKIRRNGKTIIKPRVDKFHIPVKAGLKVTFRIDTTDLDSLGVRKIDG